MTSHEVLAFDVPPRRPATLWASIKGYPEWLVRAAVAATENGPTIIELCVRPRASTKFDDGTSDEPASPQDMRVDANSVPAGGVLARLVRAINAGELLDLARGHGAATAIQAQAALHYLPAPLAVTVVNAGEHPVFMPRQSGAGNYVPTTMTLRGVVPGRTVRAVYGQEVSSVAPDLVALGQETDRPGRRGYGIDYYLDWSVRYDDLVSMGVRSPIAVLAEEEFARYGGDIEKIKIRVRDTIQDAGDRHGLLTSSPRGLARRRLTDKARKLLAERNKMAEAAAVLEKAAASRTGKGSTRPRKEGKQ